MVTYHSHSAFKRSPEARVILVYNSLSQDWQNHSLPAIHVDELAQFGFHLNDRHLTGSRRPSRGCNGVIPEHDVLEKEIGDDFGDLLVRDKPRDRRFPWPQATDLWRFGWPLRRRRRRSIHGRGFPFYFDRRSNRSSHNSLRGGHGALAHDPGVCWRVSRVFGNRRVWLWDWGTSSFRASTSLGVDRRFVEPSPFSLGLLRARRDFRV